MQTLGPTLDLGTRNPHAREILVVPMRARARSPALHVFFNLVILPERPFRPHFSDGETEGSMSSVTHPNSTTTKGPDQGRREAQLSSS